MSKDIVSPRTLSVHKEHELLGKLEAAGLADAEAQLVIESKGNELARKLVALIRMGGYELFASQKTARAILGPNYIGLERSIEHLMVRPSMGDLAILEKVPFGEAVLEACKETHVLVAMLPMSVMALWERVRFFHIQENPWFRNEVFARKRGRAGWHLVRKDIVPNSTSKTWQEQQSLLGKDEEVPTARVLIYAIILTYLATGVKLFPSTYARVSDVTSSNDFRVYIGLFGNKGLDVCTTWNRSRDVLSGLASSRKSA